jgi:superfamily II DNA helicase RecQ
MQDLIRMCDENQDDFPNEETDIIAATIALNGIDKPDAAVVH